MTPIAFRRIVPALLLGLAACSTEPDPGDSLGAIRVTVSTGGEDLDLDAYQVRVDQAEVRDVQHYGREIFTDLPVGVHQVELIGVAENCVAPPGLSRDVTVAARDTVTVAFAVMCLATGVRIHAPADGIDLDLRYTATVDGAAHTIAAFGTLTVTRMTSGVHTVALGDVADNCRVTGPNPVNVTVPVSQVVDVGFAVICVAATGVLEVSVVGSGTDLDFTGYSIRLNGGAPQPVPAAGFRTFAGVPVGDYRIDLGDVDSNCSALEPFQTARITAGAAVRDTARVTFHVSCVRRWDMAFERDGAVFLAGATDGEPVRLGPGSDPAWSPDGSALAWECNNDICSMRVTAGTVAKITAAPAQLGLTDPAWHPGGKLSFVSWICDWYCYYWAYGGVLLANPDGSERTPVPLPALESVGDVAWSPDGTLAFACSEHGKLGVSICLAGKNGSFQRLRPGPVMDRSPAWSPDGSLLAFSTNLFRPTPEIVTRDASGQITRIAPGIKGEEPTWTHDGRIVFAASSMPGLHDGLFVVNADGSGLARLTTGLDRNPAWRPR